MKSGLFLAAAVLCCGKILFAAPVILNPSFEENSATVWPGSTPVIGWTSSWHTGLNPILADEKPVYDNLETVTDLAGSQPLDRYPFADNGKIPHGNNVAYFQGGPADADPSVYSVHMLQPVTGFEAGKSYSVVYYCNGRAGYRTPVVQVSLDNVMVDGPVAIPSVAPRFNRTVPYRKRISKEFNAAGTGPYVLKFAAYSDGADKVDTALLLDNVSLIELGDLKVTSARRLYQKQTEVEVRFSKPVEATSAADPQNYQVAERRVEEAKVGTDGQTVLLKVSAPIENGSDPLLTVGAVVDVDGRGIFRNNSTQRVITSAILPSEIGTSVTSGFLDDFNEPHRHSDWKRVGGVRDLFVQNYGYLRILPGDSSASHLVLNKTYDLKNQEILAKIRVVESGDTSEHPGLSLAVNEAGQGMRFGFHQTATSKNFSFLRDFDGTSTNLSSWDPHQWYWVRVQHTNVNGKSIVQSKTWRADGDATEPAAFQSWDYAATGVGGEGLAGFSSGGPEEVMELDVDWVLIKAANLPPVDVTGPQEFGATPLITVLPQGIRLSWPVELKNFQLQENPLLDPYAWSFFLGTVEQSPVEFKAVIPSGEMNNFYRLIP